MHTVVDDYLEAIYVLHSEGEDAFAVTLADAFHVSRANASATLQRMVRDGLVTIEGRQIALTTMGRVGAETWLRRHRIVERFLVDVLGLDWTTVHEQARRFASGLTPLLEERIDARLGHPRTCPHGNPIPRADLDAATYLQTHRALRLAAAGLNEPRTMLAISELIANRPDVLRFCAAHGLRPGVQVTPVDEVTSTGSLHVRLNRETIEIDRLLAQRIWTVREAGEHAP